MGDAFKKVQAGQRLEIPAVAYNAFVDAALDLRARQVSQGRDADRGFRQAGIILVRNDTGEDLGRFAVLALRDPIISPGDNEPEFKNRVAFRGEKPVEPVADERFVVLVDPLPEDAIGRAVIDGVTPVKVDVGRESDVFAEPVADESGHLRTSSVGGARLLWKEDGTGEKWSVIRLGDQPRFAVFELGGTWVPGTGAGDPPEPTGWAKMEGCSAVLYVSDTGTYTPSSEPPQTIWHAAGYPPAERDQVIGVHQSTTFFPSKFACGDWAWCIWNEHEARWQILGGYEDHWRFELLADLSRGGSAPAKLVLDQGGTWDPVDLTFTVHDSANLGRPDVATPTGTRGVSKHFADSCKWEILALGDACPCGSGSGSDSSSDSSSSPGVLNLTETDVRCEGGVLNVYNRTVSVTLSGGELSSYTGPWTFSHEAGCCDCDGSGSGSDSSSEDSSSDSSSEDSSSDTSSEDSSSEDSSSDSSDASSSEGSSGDSTGDSSTDTSGSVILPPPPPPRGSV